jgi:uncharacterized protein YjbJ (UPF0337 family)
MGLGDKISNAAEDAKGKVKEATGKTTDDESLEAEGKGDQAKSDHTLIDAPSSCQDRASESRTSRVRAQATDWGSMTTK